MISKAGRSGLARPSPPERPATAGPAHPARARQAAQAPDAYRHPQGAGEVRLEGRQQAVHGPRRAFADPADLLVDTGLDVDQMRVVNELSRDPEPSMHAPVHEVELGGQRFIVKNMDCFGGILLPPGSNLAIAGSELAAAVVINAHFPQFRAPSLRVVVLAKERSVFAGADGAGRHTLPPGTYVLSERIPHAKELGDFASVDPSTRAAAFLLRSVVGDLDGPLKADQYLLGGDGGQELFALDFELAFQPLKLPRMEAHLKEGGLRREDLRPLAKTVRTLAQDKTRAALAGAFEQVGLGAEAAGHKAAVLQQNAAMLTGWLEGGGRPQD
jgi:hypothetical protein